MSTLAFIAAGLLIIKQLIALGMAGADLIAAVETLHQKVKAMLDENRDPTEAEWAWLNSQIATDTAALNADPATATAEVTL